MSETPARYGVEFAAPLEITFELDGHELTVRPASVAQLARMLRQARPLLDDLMALDPAIYARAQAGEDLAPDDVLQMLELLSDHDDMPLQLVAIATGMKADAVGAMLPDRFAYLFSLVVQVNADFFFKALPVLTYAGSAMKAAVAARLGAPEQAASRPTGAASSTS